MALQRSAGNASTLALLRRAGKESAELPITLTIPGVVDHAGVFSWGLGRSPHPTDLSLVRPTDGDSPRLLRAVTDGSSGTATLAVRKVGPVERGHALTLTLEGCTVSSYQAGENDETIGLTFARLEVGE